MRVLVTGGTGFVGSHAVEALLEAGHEVRLMVRRPAKVDEVLGPRGIVPTEVVAGDMTDADAVRAAIEGCDAVLHAAAAVGVATGDVSATRLNVVGTRNVVGQAVELGCDPVLYTSSVAVLYPPDEAMLTVDSPLGTPISEYGKSKVESEQFVRGLQADGAPVVSLLVGGVYGPDQPELDSAMTSIVAASSQAMVITRSGVAVLDVRDLAQIFVRALEPDSGPRRYLAAGQFLSWPEWTDAVDAVIGRRCRRFKVPASMMLGLGRLLDRLKRIRQFDYPLTYEAAIYMTSGVPTDDSAVHDDLGVTYRPIRETFTDSTRWLIEAGHLDAKHAPRVAGLKLLCDPQFGEAAGAVYIGPRCPSKWRAGGGRSGMRKPQVLVGVMVVAALAIGTAVGASHDFEDVPDSNPFHDDVSWLADSGVTDGFVDGTFRPGQPVTRGSVAAFLRRLAGGDPAVDPVVDAAELDGRTPADYDDAVTLNGRTPADYDNAVTLNGRTPADYDDAVTLNGRTPADYDNAVSLRGNAPDDLLPEVRMAAVPLALVPVTGTTPEPATPIVSIDLDSDSGLSLVSFSAIVTSSFDSTYVFCQGSGSGSSAFIRALYGLTVGDNEFGVTQRMNVSATVLVQESGPYEISCYFTNAVGTGSVGVAASPLTAIEVRS